MIHSTLQHTFYPVDAIFLLILRWSLPINQVMIKDVCIQWDYLFYQTTTMTEGARGTKEACSTYCSTAAFCSEVTLAATDNFVQHPGPDTLTPQINIILPGATRLLPKLYVFLAAGVSRARLTRRACKKSHYVDIYLIQFSVPYVFKRLKKQIRYSRHGEDIFQCSFMSVFFGNNVQCGVVHCAAISNAGSQP